MPSNNNNPTIGVLASGGLDNAILVAYLLDKKQAVQPFYVSSGLHWQEAELAGLKAFLKAIAGAKLAELVEFQLPLGDLYLGHWSLSGKAVPDAATMDDAVYLPGRNLLLSIKPALWCQMHNISQLALGVLGSNPFDDASDEFFLALQNVMSRLGQPPIEFLRPFGKLHKQQVMELGRGYPLGLTFSCIDPAGRLHCGKCNKCAERQAAFRGIELPDPTLYANTV